MSVGGTDALKPHVRRRRWPRAFGALLALAAIGVLLAIYFLQPGRLTALILARASRALQLELKTEGPGSYALRPEPRLVLPGLSATTPGARTPFFRSGSVEFALPWDTLRGRSSDISSIVLKAPYLDVPSMQRWLATLPPSTVPFQLPRLTHGLRIEDGTLRDTNWSIEHLDLALPSLADGDPARLDASGNLLRGMSASKFVLSMTSTPSGIGHGLRFADAHIAFNSDGELPSLTASGNLLAGDAFAINLAGNLQHVPLRWAAAIDTSFAKPGDTPFSIALDHARPSSSITKATPAATTKDSLRLRLTLGDARRQPALVLNSVTSAGQTPGVSLHGQLSHWPDAWPALPAKLASNTAPIVFDASCQGSFFLNAPVAFDIRRADASLQGEFSITDLRKWITTKLTRLLPPIEAMLHATQPDLGRLQTHDVQTHHRGNAVKQTQSGATPVIASKS